MTDQLPPLDETSQDHTQEEHKVAGDEILQAVRKLIAEGNVRRIIIKDDQGNSLMEIPVTIAVVSAVLAPVLAAVGALAALLTKCTIVVIRK